MNLGLGLRLGSASRAIEQIITALTSPSLSAADDADTPADVFSAGSYASSAGTVANVATTYFVNGANEAETFDLLAGDTLQVIEFVTDSEDNTRTFATPIVTVIPSVALSNSVAPAITGTAEIGETLTCSQGTWAGSADRIYAYQWTRDGSNIPGADSNTYTAVTLDNNRDVACIVTATDGFTEVTASAVAISVTYAAPVAAGALSDQTYTIDTGNKIVNAATDFTGAVGGSWSVSGAGASIDSAGVVTIPTDTLRSGVTVTVTYTNSGGSDTSAFSVTVAGEFSVTLASDGTLEIDGNDGRDFTVDDEDDRYDGTYSADPADLANGPVALKAPVLSGTGEAGETLTIIPALFAYDSDLGDVTVTYTTTGENDVDDTDPDNPTLLIDAADADSTITVTATATQGSNTTDSVSNGVSIAAAPSASVTASYVGSFDESTVNATSGSGTFDLSGAEAGDRLVIMYGTASVTEPSLTVAGNAVPASIVDTSDGAFGGKNFVFEYELTGNETASTVVAFSGADAGNGHFVSAVLVKGGTRDDAGIEFQGQVNTVSVSVTPATAENVIVAVGMGRTSFFGSGRSWTNATEDTLASNTPNNRAAAVAFAADVPASAYTVSFDPDPGAGGSDEMSLAVLAYSA